jgi:hypothetical protein
VDFRNSSGSRIGYTEGNDIKNSSGSKVGYVDGSGSNAHAGAALLLLL